MPYKIIIVRQLPPRESTSKLAFLDFPNELLIAILAEIKTAADLFSVAQVCSRLHALALPLYLKYHNIERPEEEISAYVIQWDASHEQRRGHPDVLSGLNLAYHITQVDRLRFFFQDPDSKGLRNSFQQAFRLPDAIQRTYPFVERLRRINKAEIYLVWDAYFILNERSINYVPWSELKKWTASFEQMLNLLVERGCTSLTVQYDAPVQPPFQFKQPSKVMKYLSQNQDLQWQFERNIQEDSKALAKEPEPVALLSLPAKATKSVTSLAVYSTVLVLPPFLKWTLSLLQTHVHLTSLSFAYITISAEHWSTILPAIASALSGRLTNLSFFRNCPHLDGPDLLQFISTFPDLVHLSIDRSLRSRFIEPPQKGLLSHSMRFNKLEVLQCPVELLALILNSSTRTVDPLPMLRRLTVYPCSITKSPSSFSTSKSPALITDLLDRIMGYTRHEAVYCALDVQIEFKELGAAVRFMEEQRDAIDKAITSASSTATHTSPSVIRKQVLGARRASGLPILLFDHIRHVILFRLVQDPDSVCRQLGVLFPNLLRLTVTCQLDSHPVVDYQMEQTVRRTLMRKLRVACPKANTLVVGKMSYNLYVQS